MDDTSEASKRGPSSEATVFAPAAAGVRPGTRLNGVYEIDALIANGGMGEVYRGHNIQTNDPVAIKMILSELAGNPDAFALFRREASTLHNMNHEAIVRYFVFSVDPALQRAYLAMEYVEGPSLGAHLRRGPLDVASVEILRRRLADALETAHRFGVIHRDISSDNIILPDGDVRRAKIIDFGIARSLKPGEGTIIGGGFAGKYNYVSPEQLGLAGGDVTAKSDIYSLGLVLAEALRGRPIDMSGSQLEIIEKRRVVPDLSDIPEAVRPLLTAMLQPLPANRPGSMAEVAAWGAPPAQTYRTLPPLSAVPPVAPETGSRRRRVWPWLVALPLLAAVAAGIAGAVFGVPDPIRQRLIEAGVPQALVPLPKAASETAEATPPPPPPLPPLAETEKLPKPDPATSVDTPPPIPGPADTTAPDKTATDTAASSTGTPPADQEPPTGTQDADRLREQLIEAAAQNRANNDRKIADAKAADERAAEEKAAEAKAAADKAAADKAASDKAAADKAAADKLAADKAAADKAAADKLAADKAAADKLAADKAAADKAAADKAAADKAAADKAAADKLAAAKAAADKAAADKAAADKAAQTKVATAEPPRAPQSILTIAGAKVGEPYVANLPPFDDAAPAGLALSVAPSLPEGLAIVDHGRGIGTISGTPKKAGVFTFDVVATNAAGLRASMTTMVTITDVPVAPKADTVAALTPRDAILKTVRGFDGGPCFYIRSVDATDTSATIEGFGTKPAPFEALDKAILGAHGFEPLIAVRSVSAVQCAVIDAAALLNRGVTATPTVSLKRADVRPGEPLIGRVEGVAGRKLALLLVTQDGTVINLAKELKPSAEGATFSLPFTDSPRSIKTPQILLAIVTDAPVQALADVTTGSIDDILPRLQAEVAEAPGAALDVQRFRFVE